MTHPIKYCVPCNRTRDCLDHLQAEFPPEAAEKWLRRSCPRKGERPRPCDIRYRAGIGFGGPVTGMGS